MPDTSTHSILNPERPVGRRHAPVGHMPARRSVSNANARISWVFFGIIQTGMPFAASAQEAIPVEGLTNRQVCVDSASFRVPIEVGFAYGCWLNDQPVPAGISNRMAEVDYHELRVVRTNTQTGAVQEELLPFIIRSQERGNSEWGLPPWTPYPVIPSAPAEFSGLVLQVVIPKAWPMGLEIPVAAWVENEQGQPARLNGTVTIRGFENNPVFLRRGYGGGLLPAATGAQDLSCHAQLHSLEVLHTVAIEKDSPWQRTSGTISGTVVWPQNSRVFLTNHLVIPAGAAIEVEAGTIVKLGSLVNIQVDGQFIARGTEQNPVAFVPDNRAQPWGGFLARTNTAVLHLTGAILTGGGGDTNFFRNNFGSAHRPEQALLVVQHGARAALTNSFLIDNPGQAANGYHSMIIFDGCLIQRCVTAGQFEGGSVTVNRSALIEFPKDSPEFKDEDNDALYFVDADHVVIDSLIGWAKDDGLDAGSGVGAGTVLVSNCWFESCFHEGLAWSGGGRVGNTANTVLLNCGQAVEAGFSLTENSPLVFADRILCIGNGVGARFGDNYPWSFAGFLRITNSLLLYNHRDVWGMNWGDWNYRASQMDVRGNYLSAPNPWHPDNRLWNPPQDGGRLSAFRAGPSARPVGMGIALVQNQIDINRFPPVIPVGLSCFTPDWVRVSYSIDGKSGPLMQGTLEFPPGQTIAFIQPSIPDLTAHDLILVSLVNPQGAELTGFVRLFCVRLSPPSRLALRWLRTRQGLVLAWPDTGATLERADSLQGPWKALAEAKSPLVFEWGDSDGYFRLRQ